MTQDNEQAEEQLAARLAQQNRMTRNNMPATKEWVDMSTEILWYKYTQLKLRGFKDDQALELIKSGSL